MAESRRITVAHVVWSLEVGGLERVVVELVRSLDPSRYRSVVCCLENEGDLAGEIRDRAGAIVALGKPPGRTYGLWPRIGRWMRAEAVDVVHAHNFGPLLYGAVGARLSRFPGRPRVIYTLHGPEAAERRDYRRLVQFGLVDAMVAVSDHVRDVAVGTGGVDRARIATIRNGVDVDAFSAGEETRTRARADLGLGPGDTAIAVVARLSHEKDHATLIDAFGRVFARHAGARLLVVGDGPLRGELEQRVEQGGLGPAVTFLGTRSDVPYILSACDLFVMTSRIEGLGITLLEAMAAGLATVASATGGIVEIVDDRSGRLVPAGGVEATAEAIAWMIEHPAAAAAMGKVGRERVARNFSVETMAAAYDRVYQGVLSRR